MVPNFNNNDKVTQEQIELELMRREEERRVKFRAKFSIEAKDGFWEFEKYINPEFFIDKKTLLYELATILNDVSRGKYKKVAISMMPRAGKSYTVSVWCLWMLGHYPDKTIMRNTYGARLANKFSRDIRNMIGVPGEGKTEINRKVEKIFPNLKLAADKKSVDEWALSESKDISYFCGGAGGAITGLGCNLAMILDDPIKNMEEAQSENRLEDVEAWYHSTHRTRMELNSNCVEIIIMTRWSVRDTIGMRLETEPGEWKEFIYPALRGGKSICEAIAPTKELLKIKQGLTNANLSNVWDSLYMAEPFEMKGRLFPKSKLRRCTLQEMNRVPTSLVLGFVDFADGGGDYVAAPFGRIYGSDVYVADLLFSKKAAEDSEADLTKKFIDNLPVKVTFEANSGGKMYSIIIRRNIRKILRTNITCKTTCSNKMARIISWSGIIIKNFIFLAESEYEVGSEYDLFMKNLTTFTRDGKNKNDDAPDSCSGLAAMLGIKSGLKISVITGR